MIVRSIIQVSGARSEIEEALGYEQQRYWTIDYGLKADFKIENVRFIHDPNWRGAFFSVQGIRDVYEGKYEAITPRVVVWRAVHVAWFAAWAVVTIGYGGIVLLMQNPTDFLLLLGPCVAFGLLVSGYRAFEGAVQDWLLRRALKKIRDERVVRIASLADQAIGNARANMRAHRNRVRVTVAGNIYQVRAA